jgi:peroxiredoxin
LFHSLRLGSVAPNFQAETTEGPIDFHEFIGDKWVILFSHPEDYTPVCTTELGAFAKLEPEFTKRGVKLIGLSANTLGSHEGWIKDIDEVTGSQVTFPIIADKQRQVALLYDMYVCQSPAPVANTILYMCLYTVPFLFLHAQVRSKYCLLQNEGSVEFHMWGGQDEQAREKAHYILVFHSAIGHFMKFHFYFTDCWGSI